MKSASASMITHIGQQVTTLATCWTLTRQDGVILRLTDHDQDIVFSGNTYLARTGFTRSQIGTAADMSVDGLEVVGILDSAEISGVDLRNGLFNGAGVELFAVNWQDPDGMGRIILQRGVFGEAEIDSNGKFRMELLGLSALLSRRVLEVYTPDCRADLYGPRCLVVAATFRQTDTVGAVTNNQVFTGPALSEVDDYFNYGSIKWTGGLNTGLVMEVKNWDNTSKDITLYIAMPFDVAIGDTFEILPGCDKSIETCRAKFDNVLNFRGEPHVPGNDAFRAYPDAQA